MVDIANAAADWLAGKPVVRNSATMRRKAEEIQRLVANGQVTGVRGGTPNIERSEEFSIPMTNLGG